MKETTGDKKYKVVNVEKSELRKANLNIAVDSVILSAGLALAYTSFAMAFPEYSDSGEYLPTFLSLFGGGVGSAMTIGSTVGIVENMKTKYGVKRKIKTKKEEK